MPAGNITQTLAQTLLAARIVADESAIPAAITSAGQIYYDAGKEIIDRYAPDAPVAMKHLALVRLVGYFWNSDNTLVSRYALRDSGALNILARWRVHRLGIVGTDGSATPAAPAGLTEEQVLQLIEENAPTGGLDQDAVDGRVDIILDAAIPQNRRIPGYDIGDAGESLQVASDGMSIRWAPGPAGPQGPQGDPGPAGPQGPPGSGGGTSNELSVLASLPSISGYSVGDIINFNGVFYELVASTEDQNIYRGTIAQVSAGFLGDSTFEYQTVSPFNRRLYIPNTAPGFSSPPATIYSLVQTPSPHGLYSALSWGRAAADDNAAGHPNTYAYHKPPGDPTIDALPIGTPFSLSFYSDEGLKTALNFHSANRWERDDRNEASVNPIALAGNDDRWGYPKLPSDVARTGQIPHLIQPESFDETFPGFQINPTSQDRFSTQMTLLSPAIDLDDNPHGEFHTTISLTLTAANDTNAGFTANDSSHRTLEDESTQFASNVSELDTFSTGSLTPAAIDGLGASLYNIPVYSAATLVGRYKVLLVKDAQNRVGVYYYWDSQNVGSTQYTITAELRITFWPTDAPATGGSASLTANETTTSVFGNANRADLLPESWTIAFISVEIDSGDQFPAVVITKARWDTLSAGNAFTTFYNSDDSVQFRRGTGARDIQFGPVASFNTFNRATVRVITL